MTARDTEGAGAPSGSVSSTPQLEAVPRLSHVGATGEARMVDVSGKAETVRTARAAGTIRMAVSTLAAIRENRLAKGDVIAVARVAGVMGAKRTAGLIPLCHPLPLTDVQVEVVEDRALPGLRVEVTVRTVGRTGVEMEALTGVSVTLLTLFDMVKGLDSDLLLSNISVLSKTGGKTSSHNDSGHGTP